MLYMIYGLTSIVGNETRKYFAEQGIELIRKLTYETENVRVHPTTNAFTPAVTEEEVRSCDYVYENHGRIVGFNFDQIIDALNGKKNCLLTFSADSVELLEQIKAAYRNRVVSIFAYIDKQQLETLTYNLPHDASDSEIHHRLEMGRWVKQCYLQNRHLFDETVIYGGEDTVLDLNALRQQYDHVFEKYKDADKDLIDLPYMGNKPYIFISYARDDKSKVLPILKFLQSNGCRIWYDMGIKVGENWSNILADKIAGCTQFIVFSSENSTVSKWTKREIHQADECDKPILTIRMDESRFDGGTEMRIKDYQHIFSYHDQYEVKLLQSIDKSVIETLGTDKIQSA